MLYMCFNIIKSCISILIISPHKIIFIFVRQLSKICYDATYILIDIRIRNIKIVYLLNRRFVPGITKVPFMIKDISLLIILIIFFIINLFHINY